MTGLRGIILGCKVLEGVEIFQSGEERGIIGFNTVEVFLLLTRLTGGDTALLCSVLCLFPFSVLLPTEQNFKFRERQISLEKYKMPHKVPDCDCKGVSGLIG